MNKYLLTIPFILFILSTCGKRNAEVGTEATISTDTTIFYFEPNLIAKTMQYLKDDSLNMKLVKEEFYSDSLLLKEIYSNDYRSSEYLIIFDGEYIYYYNKDKLLILKYYVDLSWYGDTIKYQYHYENNGCRILVSDCRRRLKNDSINHRCMIDDDDYTEERIWQHSATMIEKYDEKGRIIEELELNPKAYSRDQNRYTYEYDGDKLVKKMGFLSNTTPYWTETIEYEKNTIVTTNVNHDSFPIPFYTEIQTLDVNGNIVLLETYDDKRILMDREKYIFDSNNRLVKKQCFNEKDELTVTHFLTYELIK